MNHVASAMCALAAAVICVRVTGRARLPRRNPVAPGDRPARRVDARVTRVIASWRSAAHRRRVGITPDAVVAWCDSIARRARSGITLREAVRLDVPTDAVLDALTVGVRRDLDRGRTLATAITACAVSAEASRIRGHRHLDLACAALGAAAELGGSAAAALDRVAVTLRLRAADHQERAAHSAQARLSAHVLTLVPVGIVALLAASDPAVRDVISAPLGVLLVTIGLALNGFGWWWMRRIIGGAR